MIERNASADGVVLKYFFMKKKSQFLCSAEKIKVFDAESAMKFVLSGFDAGVQFKFCLPGKDSFVIREEPEQDT